jgi:hypothetical protein
MSEIKNVNARCLDMASDRDVVLHEVSYEIKDSGVWVAKTTQVMATDPMDAIASIVSREV